MTRKKARTIICSALSGTQLFVVQLFVVQLFVVQLFVAIICGTIICTIINYNYLYNYLYRIVWFGLPDLIFVIFFVFFVFFFVPHCLVWSPRFDAHLIFFAARSVGVRA